jgi:hypothetical protein
MQQNRFLKWVVVWILAILVTGAAMVYQSLNGPTKPMRVTLWLNEAQEYSFRLPRSHGGPSGCPLNLVLPDSTVTASVVYRLYPSEDPWAEVAMERSGDTLKALLPHQPPAGKLEYYFKFHQQGKLVRLPAAETVVIRFRGDVPAGVIIPHAALMFFAMLLSNLTLLLVIFNMKQYKLFGIITTVSLLIGGLVFGPMVQHHAFGQYWTGFPIGFDLTDNKTLIAFVFWLLAVLGNLGRSRRLLTVLASLVMLIIFTIPHSVKGSELDRDSGTIKTGMVMTLQFKP